LCLWRNKLGIQLKGDAELNLLGGIQLRIADQIPVATVTTAATNAGVATLDATRVTTELTTTKAGK
jgi:hypothetical protein